jgi:hypothetical protein
MSSALPQGFTVDKPAAGGSSLPPGFKVDAPPPAPSLLSRIANSQQVKDLMDPGKAGQALDDMARIGVDAASFGFADPAIGYLTGEDERAKTQAARSRAGWAGTGMDVATALETAPGFVTGKLIGKAKGAIPTVARWLGYGAEGAGQAALSSVGHGETDPSKIGEQAAIGGGLGVAGQAVGGKIASWAERRRAKAAQPYQTFKDVKAAGQAKYGEVDASGAHYPISDTDTLLQSLDTTLTNLKATPGLDDRAIAVVNRLKQDWAGKPINPSELDKVRRWIDKRLIAGNPRGDDAQLGYRLREEIDKFTGTTNPIDPVTGLPDTQVNATLEDARSLYARSSRAKAVEGAEAKAQKQADKTGSALTGGNIENARRQQFDRLQTKIEEGKTGGYSNAETERLAQIVKGTVGRNIGRAGSVISPLRGGLPALLHLAAFPATGGVSTMIGGLGEVASRLSNRATSKEIEELGALVRDPSGRGLTSDPAKIEAARQFMAKLMIGGQRAAQAGGQR